MESLNENMELEQLREQLSILKRKLEKGKLKLGMKE